MAANGLAVELFKVVHASEFLYAKKTNIITCSKLCSCDDFQFFRHKPARFDETKKIISVVAAVILAAII